MTAKSTYVRLDTSVALDPAWVALGESWDIMMQSEHYSDRTRANYLIAHQRFGVFLAQQGIRQDIRRITRTHIERWMVHLFSQGYRASSVATRFRALQQFFRWLEEDGEIQLSPMLHMRAPRQPETHTPVMTDDQVSALLATCTGRDFEDRRDRAMLLLMLDTGMRRAEVVSITLEHLDLREQCVVVVGKGDRHRVVSFGVQVKRALDLYLRSRAMHRHAHLPALWIGRMGAYTVAGVRELVDRRARQAGLGDLSLHPHMFRHKYAHDFLAGGGQESDLMVQAGWRSPQMVQHYGAALRGQRARDAAKRLSPVDRRMTNR